MLSFCDNPPIEYCASTGCLYIITQEAAAPDDPHLNRNCKGQRKYVMRGSTQFICFCNPRREPLCDDVSQVDKQRDTSTYWGLGRILHVVRENTKETFHLVSVAGAPSINKGEQTNKAADKTSVAVFHKSESSQSICHE